MIVWYSYVVSRRRVLGEGLWQVHRAPQVTNEAQNLQVLPVLTCAIQIGRPAAAP